MRKTKPPMALLRCNCDTDNCDFDQLIEALSNGHGVSRSSRWHPALTVSRFDSTQPSGGRNTARPWSDFYLWQLALRCISRHRHLGATEAPAATANPRHEEPPK